MPGVTVEAVDFDARRDLSSLDQFRQCWTVGGNTGSMRAHVELDENVPGIGAGGFQNFNLLLVVYHEKNSDLLTNLDEVGKNAGVNGQTIEDLGEQSMSDRFDQRAETTHVIEQTFFHKR
jgi:hypothetical protein